jgi:hypothetical protein
VYARELRHEVFRAVVVLWRLVGTKMSIMSKEHVFFTLKQMPVDGVI